jgi:hypothetical protein
MIRSEEIPGVLCHHQEGVIHIELKISIMLGLEKVADPVLGHVGLMTIRVPPIVEVTGVNPRDIPRKIQNETGKLIANLIIKPLQHSAP